VSSPQVAAERGYAYATYSEVRGNRAAPEASSVTNVTRIGSAGAALVAAIVTSPCPSLVTPIRTTVEAGWSPARGTTRHHHP